MLAISVVLGSLLKRMVPHYDNCRGSIINCSAGNFEKYIFVEYLNENFREEILLSGLYPKIISIVSGSDAALKFLSNVFRINSIYLLIRIPVFLDDSIEASSDFEVTIRNRMAFRDINMRYIILKN